VKDRVLPKSHGCSKTFPGRNALADLPSVRKWVAELAQELDERLEMDCEQNGRFAKLLVVQVSYNTVRGRVLIFRGLSSFRGVRRGMCWRRLSRVWWGQARRSPFKPLGFATG
jgi:hypothetical protein